MRRACLSTVVVIALATATTPTYAQIRPFQFPPKSLPELKAPADADPAFTSALKTFRDAQKEADEALRQGCGRLFNYPADGGGRPEIAAGLSRVSDALTGLQVTQRALAAVYADLDPLDRELVRATVEPLLSIETRVVPPTSGDDRARASRMLAVCARELDLASADTDRINGPNAHLDFAGQYLNYRRLLNWRKLVAEPRGSNDVRPAEVVDADAAIATAERNLIRRMETHGLLEYFSAALYAGPTITDVNRLGSDGASMKSQTQTLGRLVWESQHVAADPDGYVDYGAAGIVGIEPALAVFSAVPAKATAADSGGTQTAAGDAVEPVMLAADQTSLSWRLGLTANLRIPLRKGSELTGFAQVGGTHLLGDSQLVETTAGMSLLASPVDNSVGRSAWIWEYGVKFAVFDQPFLVVHTGGLHVSPQFQVTAGFRHNGRLRRAGALAGYALPENRLFFSFLIDAVKLLRSPKPAEATAPLTFGFSVEHERPFGGDPGSQRIPAVTRYVIRTSIDLFQALKGGGEKPGGGD